MFRLGEDQLSCSRLVGLSSKPNPELVLPENIKTKVNSFRRQVEEALSSGRKVYGINTGFGLLSDVSIDADQLSQLQLNLIRSHACGVGSIVDADIVRGLLVLRAHTFCLGYSAVSLECIEHILAMLKHDILPAIPCQGSVGASGDLAPLAHLALGIIGEGDVIYKGQRRNAKDVFLECKLQAYSPKPKEGLSLINGTQFMSVIGAYATVEAKRLCRAADVIGAMSLDAFRGTLKAFDERIHKVRRQEGQLIVARNFAKIFQGEDPLMKSHEGCGKVQDPYSFRCIPQVHGATRDAVQYVERVLNIELNSVTDNPLFFENGDSLSGGNFHGQPVAMALDFLAIAVAELGSISERRIEKLTNPQMSGLPAFLTKDSGLNSGYMIPHVVAASLVSENKVLSHPAVVDSIPTSADKEDHVSMGPISARKARQINDHVGHILGIELCAAAQGIELLEPLRPSKALAGVLDELRKITEFMAVDRSLSQDFSRVASWIMKGNLDLVCDRLQLRLD